VDFGYLYFWAKNAVGHFKNVKKTKEKMKKRTKRKKREKNDSFLCKKMYKISHPIQEPFPMLK